MRLSRSGHHARRTGLLAGTLALGVLLAGPGAAEDWFAEGYAFTLYGAGVNTAWTTNILTGDLEFDEALFVGASVGKRLFDLTDNLSVEAELQIGRHIAGLDHWEVNGLLGLRLDDLAVGREAVMSLAVGDGLSYATDAPPNSTRLLNHLHAEIAIAPDRDTPWEYVLRYQHRSGAFGLFEGVTDESTKLGLGLRYRY